MASFQNKSLSEFLTYIKQAVAKLRVNFGDLNALENELFVDVEGDHVALDDLCSMYRKYDPAK